MVSDNEKVTWAGGLGGVGGAGIFLENRGARGSGGGPTPGRRLGG